MAKGEMVVVEKKLKVFKSDESNLLEIISRGDGIKKIGEMWLTSVEVNRIENVMIDYLL